MDLLAKAYPEAGIFVAYIGDRDSLTKALASAFDMPRTAIDRSKVRQCFTREQVAENFIRALGNCKRDWCDEI